MRQVLEIEGAQQMGAVVGPWPIQIILVPRPEVLTQSQWLGVMAVAGLVKMGHLLLLTPKQVTVAAEVVYKGGDLLLEQ